MLSEPDEKLTPAPHSAPQARRGDNGSTSSDLAAALQYSADRDVAPRVVAKGKGEIAQRIIEIAKASGIPVRKDADLAQLLSVINLEEEIPLEAFAAVAEILAFIYRTNRDESAEDGTTQRAEEELL